MKDLEFKNLKCSAIITCFSEKGEIEDFDAIQDELKSVLNDVIADVVCDRNNVLDFELSDVVILDNGVDKEH